MNAATASIGSFRSAGDALLLAAAAGRDHAAFGEIVNRYYKPVYRLIWRMTGGHADTEDVAQEVFLKLWQNPRQVREAGALKGWLMRVAANAAIDRSRKRVDASIETVLETAGTGALPGETLERNAAARELEHRVAQLPVRQRLALTLVYYEGMSNIDTAAIMQTSIEAVESLLARARRDLRDSLANEWRSLLESLSAPAT